MRIRLAFGALFVICLISFAHLPVTSGQTKNDAVSSKIEALLKERRDVLSKRVEFFSAQFHHARITRIPVLEARDDLITAEIAIAKTREDRLDLLKSRVANLKEIEGSYVALKDLSKADESDILQATSRRLLAEIELERALSAG